MPTGHRDSFSFAIEKLFPSGPLRITRISNLEPATIFLIGLVRGVLVLPNDAFGKVTHDEVDAITSALVGLFYLANRKTVRSSHRHLRTL
jgi:hypothetical protein